MSPRYIADPNKSTFGFTTFLKGSYRVDIGDPKAFAGKNKQGAENYGVRYIGKVIASEEHPELIGKPFPITLYEHSEGAANFSKQIEAAVLGAKDDDEFNTKFGGEDWSFNTDDGSCGGGFHLLKGKLVDIECADPEIDTNSGNLNTKVVKYRTVG